MGGSQTKVSPAKTICRSLKIFIIVHFRRHSAQHLTTSTSLGGLQLLVKAATPFIALFISDLLLSNRKS